jgi:NAD(P)-dependent dehydrogenase (short-subunit alcohol dehydrogenase family)
MSAVPVGEFLRAQFQTLPIYPKACSDGTFIVTGSNVGLGFEAAKRFVKQGARRVIIAVRSTSKGEAAKARIEAETGRRGVAQVWQLDLASYASVKAFARRASTELDRIDGVVENASVADHAWVVKEGAEQTLTVNVYSTMLLAVLLMPKLKECAATHKITPHLTVVISVLGFNTRFLKGMEEDTFVKLNEETKDAMKDR